MFQKSTDKNNILLYDNIFCNNIGIGHCCKYQWFLCFNNSIPVYVFIGFGNVPVFLKGNTPKHWTPPPTSKKEVSLSRHWPLAGSDHASGYVHLSVICVCISVWRRLWSVKTVALIPHCCLGVSWICSDSGENAKLLRRTCVSRAGRPKGHEPSEV